jgi:hypothetical protein
MVEIKRATDRCGSVVEPTLGDPKAPVSVQRVQRLQKDKEPERQEKHRGESDAKRRAVQCGVCPGGDDSLFVCCSHGERRKKTLLITMAA